MTTEHEEIKIIGEPTLEPHVCKFIVNFDVFPEGTFNCRSKEMAKGSPLLEGLFAVDGVADILLSGNTLTIAKSTPTPWPELGKEIGGVIREKINSGEKLIADDVEKRAPSDDRIRQQIEQLFEQEINPAIASHGGRVELADVDKGKVYLRLGGGCQGCASANVTLRQGIEQAIRASIPEVTEVIDVTDHTSGTDPYYR